MKRHIVMALAAVASTLALVAVPASPAHAAEPCAAYPQTPTFDDPTIGWALGESTLKCSSTHEYVIATAVLVRWEQATGQWVETGDKMVTQQRNADSATAYGSTNCKGQGTIYMRTKGGGMVGDNVLWPPPVREVLSTYSREFSCPLPSVPANPGGLKP